MSNQDTGSQVALASGINVLLGILLIVSPWFYGSTATPPAPPPPTSRSAAE